jgi:hypothetical protein
LEEEKKFVKHEEEENFANKAFAYQSIILLVQMGRMNFTSLLFGYRFPNARQPYHGSSIHQSIAE